MIFSLFITVFVGLMFIPFLIHQQFENKEKLFHKTFGNSYKIIMTAERKIKPIFGAETDINMYKVQTPNGVFWFYLEPNGFTQYKIDNIEKVIN